MRFKYKLQDHLHAKHLWILWHTLSLYVSLLISRAGYWKGSLEKGHINCDSYGAEQNFQWVYTGQRLDTHSKGNSTILLTMRKVEKGRVGNSNGAEVKSKVSAVNCFSPATSFPHSLKWRQAGDLGVFVRFRQDCHPGCWETGSQFSSAMRFLNGYAAPRDSPHTQVHTESTKGTQ